MRYRKNIITGDWIICGDSRNDFDPDNSLFESYSADYPQNVFREKINNPLFPMDYNHFLVYFENYKKWADAILKKNPQTYIFSIVKKHAEVFEKNFESEMLLAPEGKQFFDKSITNAVDFYEKNKQCLWCGIIQEEINYDKRVVLCTNKYIAFEPFASRFPYETCIMPLDHISSFNMLSDVDIKELSMICSTIIPAVYEITHKADFIINIHHINVPCQFSHCLHWYMQIIPFVNNWAGFEIATSMNINSVTPEDCALNLRKNC